MGDAKLGEGVAMRKEGAGVRVVTGASVGGSCGVGVGGSCGGTDGTV